MRRREGDGCPVTGALQMVGDKWTLLVVRDLVHGSRRTTELLESLQPISSRTLLERLRNLERDALVERKDYGGSPPRVEYYLTERGRLLLPVLDALRRLGESLGCSECVDRKARTGSYCESCPLTETGLPRERKRRAADDSIVLL